MSGTFTADLTRFVNHANGNIDAIVRKVVLDLGKEVVERSPVGDPEWWKGREVSPGVFEHARVPEGYVGGKFRANWQYGEGSIPAPSDNSPNPSESAANAKLEAVVPRNAAGKVHYIVNQLPYSIALENGHSWHQAPFGMVGLAVFKFEYFLRLGILGLR